MRTVEQEVVQEVDHDRRELAAEVWEHGDALLAVHLLERVDLPGRREVAVRIHRHRIVEGPAKLRKLRGLDVSHACSCKRPNMSNTLVRASKTLSHAIEGRDTLTLSQDGYLP